MVALTVMALNGYEVSLEMKLVFRILRIKTMFDYQVSKQACFDNACGAFASIHKGDLVQIAVNVS
ncbi:hypothetical protein [Proteus vulgaris]|uniref:hypothetical protein n=1 Tax=Proteus vulgaris TaxID=585 RepID=UPI003F75F790